MEGETERCGPLVLPQAHREGSSGLGVSQGCFWGRLLAGEEESYNIHPSKKGKAKLFLTCRRKAAHLKLRLVVRKGGKH